MCSILQFSYTDGDREASEPTKTEKRAEASKQSEQVTEKQSEEVSKAKQAR